MRGENVGGMPLVDKVMAFFDILINRVVQDGDTLEVFRVVIDQYPPRVGQAWEIRHSNVALARGLVPLPTLQNISMFVRMFSALDFWKGH